MTPAMGRKVKYCQILAFLFLPSIGPSGLSFSQKGSGKLVVQARKLEEAVQKE